MIEREDIASQEEKEFFKLSERKKTRTFTYGFFLKIRMT